MCASEGKKCLFSRKFDVLCFLETPVLKFDLLPCYQGIVGNYRCETFQSLLQPSLLLQVNYHRRRNDNRF